MSRQEPKRVLVYLTPVDSPEDRAKLEETARRTFGRRARVDYSDPTPRGMWILLPMMQSSLVLQLFIGCPMRFYLILLRDPFFY
jgi:hypothetical protein